MRDFMGARLKESVTAPRVVIVGGGFGGFYAARELRGAPVHVTLIDKRNYHLFRPMLYQVATGLLSADEIAAPLRSILSRQCNVDVLMDEVIGIDSVNRMVRLNDRGVPYDFLILATGIHYNYFGHDEWRATATPLESLEGADIIRTRVLAALERAENIAASGEADAEELRRLLTFVLVGGGTVGVELAGTLAEMFHIALKRDFRHIDLRTARILLYEAGSRVLPTYPENLSLQARRHLEGLGVEVHVNTRVTSIDASGIIAGGQSVPAATVVWGAGVVASPRRQMAGRGRRRFWKNRRGGGSFCAGPSRDFCYWRHGARCCALPQSDRNSITRTDGAARCCAACDSRREVRLTTDPQTGGESSGAPAILVLGQGRSCYCRSDLRSSGSAFRALLGISCVVHVDGSPHLFSDWICQSRFCDAAMGIRICYETAARAGS
jgi:hypothetical protein